MMLVASLIESSIAKTRMWQKHNTHFANFDKAALRVWEIHPVMKMDVVQ
jgi:hypothetical protein